MNAVMPSVITESITSIDGMSAEAGLSLIAAPSFLPLLHEPL